MIVFVYKELSKTPQGIRNEVYSIVKAISAFWNTGLSTGANARGADTSSTAQMSHEETREEQEKTIPQGILRRGREIVKKIGT